MSKLILPENNDQLDPPRDRGETLRPQNDKEIYNLEHYPKLAENIYSMPGPVSLVFYKLDKPVEVFGEMQSVRSKAIMARIVKAGPVGPNDKTPADIAKVRLEFLESYLMENPGHALFVCDIEDKGEMQVHTLDDGSRRLIARCELVPLEE